MADNTRIRYAVVSEAQQPHKFTKFHTVKDDAFLEAERLCRKYQSRFYVLKLVGIVEVDIAPVKKQEWE